MLHRTRYHQRHLQELIENNQYFEHFSPEHLAGVILWIVDSDFKIIDLSQETADYYGKTRAEMIGQNGTEFWHQDEHETLFAEYRKILSEGKPNTVTVWSLLPVGGWRKIVLTRTPLSETFIIGIGHDITDDDMLGRWLMRAQPERQRLYLGAELGDRYLSLGELMVLQRLARAHSYQAIAAELHISKPTVSYRIGRIKAKLDVDTTEAMWEKIYSIGLIHLLGLPLGPTEMFSDRRALLELDPSTDVPPRRGGT